MNKHKKEFFAQLRTHIDRLEADPEVDQVLLLAYQRVPNQPAVANMSMLLNGSDKIQALLDMKMIAVSVLEKELSAAKSSSAVN